MIKFEIKDFTLDVGTSSDLKCTSPCSKYSVLFEHGIIGDPAVGLNVRADETYGDKNCIFTAEFEVSSLMLSMKSVFLRLDGIDGACRVELNGRELAKITNVHRRYSFDVKTVITAGKNTLKLEFDAKADARRVSSFSGTVDSPRFTDMGIARTVELVGFNHKVISGLKVKQIHTENQVRLDLSLDTIGYDEMSRAVATLTSPGGMVYFCGFLGGKGSITINEPNLWWPSGLGMQNLYRLNVNLYSEREIEDTYEMRIGLRTVTFTKDAASGIDVPMINGVPMFPLGAKYKTENLLLSKITEESTKAVLEAAKGANMNSVYVDAGSYYPADFFFSTCDELGLLVWQTIPDIDDAADVDNADLAKEIMSEMSENLTRISTHPSLGVIVGNEKVARIFGSTEASETLVARFSDFDGMNVFDASGAIASGITTIAYDSVPSYESLCAFADPAGRNLGSEVMELHGATPERVIGMLTDAYNTLPLANGADELFYVLGMSSAELSRIAVEDARKSEGAKIGIFFETLNETWPSISASAVDYYGKRKPLYYFCRRFFGKINVTVERKGNRVKFIAVNSDRIDLNGVFSYSIMDNCNKPVFRDSFPIKIGAGEIMELHNADISSAINSHEREYYLTYSVSDGSTVSARGIYLFVTPKRFNFGKPKFTTSISGNGSEYTVSVSSDCFTKGVEISFPGVDYDLEDNYFDIMSKAPVRVRLRTKRPITVEKLTRIMKLRSVYDLGRDS